MNCPPRAEFTRQRSLLASLLALLSGEQLGFCGRGRYLPPTPGVYLDARASGWARTFRSLPRTTRSVRVHQSLSTALDLSCQTLPVTRSQSDNGNLGLGRLSAQDSTIGHHSTVMGRSVSKPSPRGISNPKQDIILGPST